MTRRDARRLGVVRYDSFSDVGSDRSLSLSNAEGDGVVVTSIYTREETRTYGTFCKKFTLRQRAANEEQSAILTARGGVAPIR